MSNQAQEVEAQEMPPLGIRSDLPGAKILVVDADPELRSVLVESLQKHGYEVTGCGSGLSALDELRERDFDVLMTDLVMPEMDGITLLKAALDLDPHLVGILIPAQIPITTVNDPPESDDFDYVLKPVQTQALIPVLTRALSRRQQLVENQQLRETVAMYEMTRHSMKNEITVAIGRKQTEEALRRSESELAEAQRLAHIGSWNWDLPKENHLLTWSDEHYRIFGVAPGAIDINFEEVVLDFIHPGDQETVRSVAQKAIETGEPFDFHYRIVRADGRERMTVIGGYSSILLAKLPPESPHRASFAEIKKASHRQGTETVLLVEDEEQVKAILKQILHSLGYEVLVASTALEALEISQDLKRDIKLMITDVVMPHMGGRELAERLFMIRPGLRVLFMSGYTDDAVVRHGLLDGKPNFIQKPFDSASLGRKVREVLDSLPTLPITSDAIEIEGD